MLLIGEQLDQHKSFVGMMVSMSSQIRFTLFFSDWDEEGNKYLKDEIIEMLEIPPSTTFDLFLKK